MDSERGPKRRRLDVETPLKLDSGDRAELEPPSDDDNESDDEAHEVTPKPKRPRKTVLPSTKLTESREAIARTGVVYLSRIPPRLNPPKLRHLLSPYGCRILRLFLAPEPTPDHTRRIKSGGSKKQLFTEGWVEFEDKKVAKRVAEMLNTQRMGAKKGDALYDDLWCIKYLPKFKWHHLTEQIAYQNASRKEKLRNEIAQEKRENAAFVQNSERSKMIENIQRKRQAKEGDQSEKMEVKIRRQFPQKAVVSVMKPEKRSSVLAKVFE